MKYATVEENSNPLSTTVPIINGKIARLAWYNTCDFSALSLTTLYVDTTRLAIYTTHTTQPVLVECRERAVRLSDDDLVSPAGKPL